MTRAVLAAALALLVSHAAVAEKGDREKEIVVNADHALADQAKPNTTLTFEGNVVVTQGTMRMTANRVVVRQDAQKNKLYVATGAPVTFRQKRDNVDEWVEGFAQRAEFDERNDLLKLYDRARVKQTDNELTGDYITYDMRKEQAEVGGKSRVKMILTPPKKETEGAKPAAKSPGVELKTDPGKAEPDKP